jgi:hypothetical protein
VFGLQLARSSTPRSRPAPNGAIKLFIIQATTDEGTVIELSTAALAFIAGHNSNFLFSAIEHVSAAILPKVAWSRCGGPPGKS